MGDERTTAINEAYDRNQAGRTSFYYVNTQVLERLGVTMFKTEPKDNFIRIIPPEDPKEFWALEVPVHRKIGANGATFICLKKMFNKPCPVCELIDQMKKEGIDEDKIKPLYATTRHLMFVFDVRDDSTVEKGLRWYDAPGMVVSNIINLSKDRRTKSVIDISDPVDGRDIEFVRKGSGIGSKYEAFVLRPTDPIPEDWYSNVPKFGDVLLIPTYDQIKKELDGTPEPETEESETKESETEESREEESQTETVEENVEQESGPEERKPPTARGSTRKSASGETSEDVKRKIEEIRNRRKTTQSQ